LPLALSPPSSIELGVVVDHIEAHLDTDRRELQDSITLDDFVGPTIARARVKIDKGSSCSTIAYCRIEGVAK
jgi:hypothetical protein